MRSPVVAAALAALAFPTFPAVAQDGGPSSNARRRWEWFHEQRAYPFTTIPAGALQNARAQLASSLRSSLLGQGSAPPPISGSAWEPLGPTLIGSANIGRTSAIAVHPTNGNIIYIGGAQGGVWKTIDGGLSWNPQTDTQCSLAMGSLAIDPVSPEIVYAGTGEQHFSGDSYYGCGVLRTTNGGATWTSVGAATMTFSGSNRPRISRILIAPTTAGTVASTKLWAAADNGLWTSPDGGATWVRMRTGIATDVVLDPNNENVVFVSIFGSGVYRSTDAGATWNGLGTGFAPDSIGRINLAISKTAPAVLYASVANQQSSGLRGIYKSTDGAQTWVKLSATGATCAPQCWYDMTIAVHPTDQLTIYFGGVSLFKSTNGGTSFSATTNGMHVDQHFITFDPQDAGKVYVANDGGVFLSTNGGATWTPLNNGLALTQFYPGISLHPSEPFTVSGGTQDNGTLRTTGSTNWTAILGGDGGWTAIDYENPNIRYAETQWTPNSSFTGPRRSDANGDPNSFSLKTNGINIADPGQFIPPLVMDPTDPKVLYFGTRKVYRTVDRAESWTVFSPDFTGDVAVIAPAPSAPSIVYVSTDNAQLHVGINGTWTQRNSGLPTRFITDIAVDRSDSLTAYITMSGFASAGGPPGHVFRTVNGGVSWTNVSTSLPDMPVNAVVLDPVSRGYVMIGTDLGVFVSTDSGTSWTALTNGMPNVAVFDIAYNPLSGTLIAATHGRGMFKLQLSRPLTLAATPVRRRADVFEGSTAPVADSAAVILSGTNAASAGWTATHTSASWLTLTTASGTASGRVRWTRDPTGLAAGFKVDTITITVAGATDSPLRIIDTLNIISATASVSADAQRGATLPAGVAFGPADSALVTITGGLSPISWTASKTAPWITLLTPGGTGTGHVRWTRRTDALIAGVHRDTIVITAPGATGSPVKIADSMIVTIAPRFATASGGDTVTSGTAAPRNVTQTLTIHGDPGSASWTVTHSAGATWTTLTTTNGVGNGSVQWSKSAADLVPGAYFDTITVTVSGATPLTFPDKLIVLPPEVTRPCAISHYFGTACLDATALKWMDLTGNKDGTFNLGDFLAYLARTPAAAPPPKARP